MAKDFDPYHQWLGIPPKFQPPNHYRLLAIEEFESSPDVIENAADRQIAHVRLFQSGPQGDVSQRLANEITAAKLCLLNKSKKADYDNKLRAEKEAAAAPTPPPPRTVRAAPTAPADPAEPFDEGQDILHAPSLGAISPDAESSQVVSAGGADSLPTTSLPATSLPATRLQTSRNRRSGLPPAAIAGAAGGVIVVAALIFLALRPGGSSSTAQGTRAGKTMPTSIEPLVVLGKKSSVESGRKTEESGKTGPEISKKTDVGSKTGFDTKTPEDPEPKTKPPPDKERPKQKSPEGDLADLLKVVDPSRDASAGEWTLEKGLLQGNSGDSHALLRIPFNCPREYDLRVEVRRLAGEGHLAIGLVVGQQRVTLLCDKDNGKDKGPDKDKATMLYAVKEIAEGKTLHEGRLFMGDQPVTLLIQVRQPGIAVLANDQPLFAWRGLSTELSLAPLWAKRMPGDGLFLGLQDGRFEFHKLELRRVTGAPPAVAGKKRPEVPPAAELDAARKRVREMFDAEIKAARTPQDKAALVQKLLQQAGREDEAAAKYALLDVALDMAMQAGEPELAVKASDQLAAAFNVDGPAKLLDLFTQLSAANLTPEKRKALVEAMLDAGEHAAGEENFKAAENVLALATKAAAKVSDTDVRRRVTFVRERVEQTQAWWEEAEKARPVLAERPDDPAASKAVGKHLCFASDDWENGLPYLAKADDLKLKAVATLELGSADSPAKQVIVGHAWWDQAQSATGYARFVMQKRAQRWYLLAVEGLKDPEKGTVEKRLATLEKAVGEAGGEASAAGLAKHIVGDFLAAAAGKKGKKMTTLGFAADGTVSANQLPVGRWAVDAGQVRITYDEKFKDQGTVQLHGRTKDAFEGKQTLASGDTMNWELKRVVVVSTWEVFDEKLPGNGSQRLVLYSNFKANDIYGASNWALSGNVLSLDWKDFRRAGAGKIKAGVGLQGNFQIQGGVFGGTVAGRTYRGQRVANAGPN